MTVKEKETKIKKIVLEKIFKELQETKHFLYKIENNQYSGYFLGGEYEIYVFYNDKCLQHRFFKTLSDFSKWLEPEVEAIARAIKKGSVIL